MRWKYTWFLHLGLAFVVGCAQDSETQRPRAPVADRQVVVKKPGERVVSHSTEKAIAPRLRSNDRLGMALEEPERSSTDGIEKARLVEGDFIAMHAINIGQGLAILLEFPCAAVLVDTGAEQNEAFDGVAELEKALEAFFGRRKDLKRTLASVIITHPHIDHMRGLPHVLEKFRVERIVYNGQPGDEIVERPMAILKSALDGAGPNRFRIVRFDDTTPSGMTDSVIDPVRCGDFDPKISALFGWVQNDPGWGDNRYGDPFHHNANNHSIVLRVEVGESSILITGDLEETAIPMLIEKYRGTGLLDADIYVVGHHGSHNGTTKELLEVMTPEIAVISCGPSTRERSWTAHQYGHPRETVIQLLEESIIRRRRPTIVPVAKKPRTFVPHRLDKAIFATAWDGLVTVYARDDGIWHRETTDASSGGMKGRTKRETKD